MKRFIPLMLIMALLFTGCGWMSGSYVSVTPHEEHTRTGQDEVVSASSYLQLRAALETTVSSGRESVVINVADFDSSQLESCMEMAVRYVKGSFPIGAYAVEDITYEMGASSGKPAIAVNVSYLRSYVEIRKIHRVADMAEARDVLSQTLDGHDAGVVLLVEDFENEDITQFVESYCQDYPDRVMEQPQVTVGIYPNEGPSRVVEVQLTYQNSRESLRQMQEQVEKLFTSAAMYVSPDASDNVKYTQLYTFLMERFDYKQDTSITPAYSLLRHGVGDSRAFATVYAAMCRRVGLECQVVAGTKSGEPWFWNIVCDNGCHFHVDLLRGNYRGMLDGEMGGYVWDYSGYPACDRTDAPPENDGTKEN